MEQRNLQTFKSKFTLNCSGQLISLEKPIVMGILNATPDSFYDGGKHNDLKNALNQAHKMVSEGATILDIGGYSSRPGAADISVEEECNRVLPLIQEIKKELPNVIISIDTFRSQVAEKAIKTGAHIVNDISAGEDDPGMFKMVALHQVPYIMMHKRGTPQTMGKLTQYNDVVEDVLAYFAGRIDIAKQTGIKDIVLDPGFGFAKTVDQNYALLSRLHEFHILDLPVLAGLSRKSMLQKVTGTVSQTALNATSAAHTIALMNGAKILRVHDVKEAIECINIVTAAYGII